jgi:hypothetical protein
VVEEEGQVEEEEGEEEEEDEVYFHLSRLVSI